MWQSELRTENPPSTPLKTETSPGSTPGCATERARHHRQTGALNHHFLTLLRKAEHVLGSVSFYWDKRFNKVQFRSKHPRAKAARFFPSFSIEIQAAILEIGEFFLEFHEQLQRNLRAHWIEHGDGSQGRRSETTFHITQFPTGPRWIVFDDFVKSYELLFKVRDFGI